MRKLKKYKLIIISVILYLVLFVVRRDLFMVASKYTMKFMLEMLQVMPPILIITSLVSTWVPSGVIIKAFGEKSGWKGILGAIFIGSVSAGPIYAAFPICNTLLKKGASIRNVTIIISSWAVIKVPMLLIEISFLGLKFALLRYAFTVPLIIVIALITEKLTAKKEEEENIVIDSI